MTMPRWFLLRMVSVAWDERWSENQNTILCSITFFPENIAVYKIIWINYCRVGGAIDGKKTQSVSLSCCITKAIDAHSEYVIAIAFQFNSGYPNAPEFYVLSTFRVLFYVKYFCHNNIRVWIVDRVSILWVTNDISYIICMSVRNISHKLSYS